MQYDDFLPSGIFLPGTGKRISRSPVCLVVLVYLCFVSKGMVVRTKFKYCTIYLFYNTIYRANIK